MSKFDVNKEILAAAGAVLSRYERIYWVIGGACSGKSTVCQAISTQKNIPVYDMDAHSFGVYMERYTWERHPASKTWFSAGNPLAWALSLSWREFGELYRAANAEYLDLFAKDVAETSTESVLIVDGGVTHPSVLAQVIPPERIFCIEVDVEQSARMWNEDEGRVVMKQLVLDLPDGEAMWRRFLEFDRAISENIVDESRSAGIRVFRRDDGLSVAELTRIVMEHLRI